MKEYPILFVDKVNKNGRIYPTEVVKAAIEAAKKEIEQTRFFIEKNNESLSDVLLENVVGLVKSMRLDEDAKQVLVSVKPLLNNDWLEAALDAKALFLVTKGTGSYVIGQPDTPAIIDDFKLTSIFLTSDPSYNE